MDEPRNDVTEPAPSGNGKRIAVVAVHGVGDHPPFASARNIGDLLANLKEPGTGEPRYSVFRENVLRLNVRKTLTRGHLSDIEHKHSWGPMHAMARAARQGKYPDAAAKTATHSLDHLFMEGQLAEFKSEKAEDTYQFLRIDGELLASPDREVRIYEMYWSDLSRLGTAFTRVFYELYQLLFHLISIGAHNVQSAAINLRETPKVQWWWTLLSKAYMGAECLLAWPIALLNLFLLAFLPGIIGISLLRIQLPVQQAFLLIDGLYSVLLASIAGWLLLKRTRLALAWFVAPILVAGAVGAGMYAAFAQRVDQEFIDWALFVFLILGSVVAVNAVIQAYGKRRPGSGRAALVLAAMFFAAVAWEWNRLTFLAAPRYYAIVASANGIEILLKLLVYAWSLFGAFYLISLLLSALAVWKTPVEKRGPARRAAWTAVLTLTLSPMLFLILTLAGWTGILKMVTPILPNNQPGCSGNTVSACPSVWYSPVAGGDTAPLQIWADRQMNRAGLQCLPLLFVALLVSLLITAWSLWPAVWAEISPPVLGLGESRKSFRQKALALGNWLNCGFRLLYLAGWILVICMTLLLLLANRLPENQDLTAVLGTLVAGAATGLIAFGGRLSDLALGFRPLVRVLLDVDNWLREQPRDSNPTARICARFVTLLRHISTHDQPKYDALVIIAHSQGTVITADLLRFLNAEYKDARDSGQEYDPELTRILSGALPVYLFTMGCPLRQLYGLRFPYLYGWARQERPEVEKFQPPDIVPVDGDNNLPLPDPAKLGVERWVNAFRSGDYIGRHLWRPDRCAYSWHPVDPASAEGWDPPAGNPEFVSSDSSHTRVEFCIGPGAHTHYWDSTARPIAEALSRILDNV